MMFSIIPAFVVAITPTQILMHAAWSYKVHLTIAAGKLPAFSLVSCSAWLAHSGGDYSGDGLYGMRTYFVLMLFRLYVSIVDCRSFTQDCGDCGDLVHR